MMTEQERTAYILETRNIRERAAQAKRKARRELAEIVKTSEYFRGQSNILNNLSDMRACPQRIRSTMKWRYSNY